MKRIKRPDSKNALSIIESAKEDITCILKLKVNEESSAVIVRTIYESFRMLGDALLVAKGIESEDHVEPIQELMSLDIELDRPLNILDNLRRLRHNINYYGYRPSLIEAEEVYLIGKNYFEKLYNEVKKRINI